IVRADDRQTDFLFLRKLEEAWEILGGNVDVLNDIACFEKAFSCGSRVAGGAPHPGNVRGLRKFPNEGVFASARTNDKDFQSLNELYNSGTLHDLPNLPCL